MFFIPAIADEKPNYKFINDYTAEKKNADSFADLNNENFFKYATEKQNVRVERYVWQSQAAPAQIGDSVLGFKNNPSTHGRRIIRELDGRLVYDSIYSIDQYGRRMHSETTRKSCKKFIALFGCSFTFGHALDDDETVGYYLNTQSEERFCVYNYGTPGAGTNHVAAIIKNTVFEDQIPAKKGTFIYLFMDEHIRRSVGLHPGTPHQRKSPYFEKNQKGEMVNTGSINQRRAFFLSVLSYFEKYFGDNILKDREFPVRSASDINYVCDLLIEAKKKVKLSNAENSFIVYLHSYFPTDAGILSCLKTNKIEYIEGQNIEYRKNYIISGEEHPNANWNKRIANEINEYLIIKNKIKAEY